MLGNRYTHGQKTKKPNKQKKTDKAPPLLSLHYILDWGSGKVIRPSLYSSNLKFTLYISNSSFSILHLGCQIFLERNIQTKYVWIFGLYTQQSFNITFISNCFPSPKGTNASTSFFTLYKYPKFLLLGQNSNQQVDNTHNLFTKAATSTIIFFLLFSYIRLYIYLNLIFPCSHGFTSCQFFEKTDFLIIDFNELYNML